MSNIFIVAAKRTPFGAFGGSLKKLSSTELGTIATKAALTAGNVDPSTVDAVYFGNVIQSSSDAVSNWVWLSCWMPKTLATILSHILWTLLMYTKPLNWLPMLYITYIRQAYLARHVGLKCGIPINSPALTINRLCGSGFETVIQGAKSIKLNEAKIVVCGGSENMSMAPLQVDGNDARWGGKLRSHTTIYNIIMIVSCDYQIKKEHFWQMMYYLVLCSAIGFWIENARQSLGWTDGSTRWHTYGHYCRESCREVWYFTRGTLSNINILCFTFLSHIIYWTQFIYMCYICIGLW